MRSLLQLLATVTLLAPAAGCALYFGGEDPPPPPCGVGPAIDSPAVPLRNPDTGACEAFGGGGGGGCYGEPAAPTAPWPNWATCGGACEVLDEGACLTAPGCRAAYVDIPVACPADVMFPCDPIPSKFLGCWGVAPSGPVQGACAGLDAQACSEHDDCTAHFFEDPSLGATRFAACADEAPAGSCATGALACAPGTHCEDICSYPGDGGTGGMTGGGGSTGGSGGGGSGGTGGGTVPPGGACAPACVPDAPNTCDGVACPVGAHCELSCLPCDPSRPDPGCMSTCGPTCVPDASSCAAVDCAPGYACVEVCSAGTPGSGVPGTCQATCVPANPPPGPGACTGPVTCGVAPPMCPAGSVAGIANGCWTGYCIPTSACGPSDPGACGGPVTCMVPPPSCPAGSVAGVANGCWTGFCIPAGSCPVVACEALGSEGECQARRDCTPVYQGLDCTCTPFGCTCASQVYDHCQPQAVPPPMPL